MDSTAKMTAHVTAYQLNWKNVKCRRRTNVNIMDIQDGLQ